MFKLITNMTNQNSTKSLNLAKKALIYNILFALIFGIFLPFSQVLATDPLVISITSVSLNFA